MCQADLEIQSPDKMQVLHVVGCAPHMPHFGQSSAQKLAFTHLLPLCLTEPEDCYHLFISTADPLSRFGVSSSYGRGRISSRRMMASHIASTEDWWRTSRQGIPKPMRRNFDTIAILIHWRVWKERNSMIFDQTASRAERVLLTWHRDLWLLAYLRLSS